MSKSDCNGALARNLRAWHSISYKREGLVPVIIRMHLAGEMDGELADAPRLRLHRQAPAAASRKARGPPCARRRGGRGACRG